MLILRHLRLEAEFAKRMILIAIAAIVALFLATRDSQPTPDLKTRLRDDHGAFERRGSL